MYPEKRNILVEFREDNPMKHSLIVTAVVLYWGIVLSDAVCASEVQQPNILFIIADDWSWPHARAYDDSAVKTPAFDRIAKQGLLFNYAYSAVASCTISRNVILTGLQPWQLEEGAVFGATLPNKFDVFPLLLEKAGYEIAWAGKSWGPGDLKAGGWKRHPVGKQMRPAGVRPDHFKHFLAEREKDRPFFFWFGSSDPHRSYKYGSGVQSGKKLEDVTVPAFWPDVPEVRHDILDYYVKVEKFDHQVGQLLESLRLSGQMENTIVIVTSDHGMPFPRCKADCYDMSNHVPLAIRWPGNIAAGRIVDDFANLSDIAPTLLEVAGADIPAAMTGRSLMKVLKSKKSGLVDSNRNFTVTSIERHGWCRPNDVAYPIRAIRTHENMYIQNLEPARWPNGDPHYPNPPYPGRGTGFMNIDPSPTKSYLIDHAKQANALQPFRLCLAKRPAEELYEMKTDRWQTKNLATDSNHAAIKNKLRKRLEKYLAETNDPRSQGKNPFDGYPLRYRFDPPLYPRKSKATSSTGNE